MAAAVVEVCYENLPVYTLPSGKDLHFHSNNHHSSTRTCQFILSLAAKACISTLITITSQVSGCDLKKNAQNLNLLFLDYIGFFFMSIEFVLNPRLGAMCLYPVL